MNRVSFEVDGNPLDVAAKVREMLDRAGLGCVSPEIEERQPANPVRIGRIAEHGSGWAWFRLDSGTEALRKGDRIRVRPVSEEWPFRTGIGVVLGVIGDTVNCERPVWRDIVAIADLDHVYLVGRDQPISDPGGHAKALALMAWFAARGATNAGQWPGDPDDCAKQNKARDDFEAWWKGP